MLSFLPSKGPGRQGSAASDERGFTLLEILAALSVVAIGLFVLLQTDGLNTSRTLHAIRLQGAVFLAREQMEEVFSRGVPEMAQEETAEEGGIYTWSHEVTETEFTGVREISVTVKWFEGQREETYSVVAYVPE